MAFTGNAAVVASHPALRLLSSSTDQTAFVAAAQAAPDGGGGTYAYVPTDTSSGCLFTGSVSGTTLTVTAVTNGALAVGLNINRGDTGETIGTIVPPPPPVTGTGGTGTYNLSASASIAGPLTFTADDDSFFIVAVDGGRWFNVGYYQQTAAEIAAGVTPVNYVYPPGDVRRQGMIDDGTTDCTIAFQQVLKAAAGVVKVIVPSVLGLGYKINPTPPAPGGGGTGPITVGANTTIELVGGAQLTWTATVAGPIFQTSASKPGLLINGSNFKLMGIGKITGPSVGVYAQCESAIMGFGASRTAPFTGFTVEGQIEFCDWGWGACFIQFFTNVRWCNTCIHHVGYIGAGFASCVNGVVQGNRIDTVTPGSGGNAYGITCTHDSTAYSSDPNAATNGRIVANPFCIAFDVAYNTIMNIPIWEGIDAHGGYELHFHHNNVYNCAIGIALAGGSGAATNYSGEDNEVSFNNIYLNKIDGTATTATPSVGIELKGGTTVLHRKARCIGNTVDGYGNTAVTSYSIDGTNCLGLVVADNIINNWEGYGFYAAGAEGTVANNVFGPVGASNTGSACIFLDTTTSSWNVTGNRHLPIGDTGAAMGLCINNVNNPRCLVQGNNFGAAAAPFGGFADGFHTIGDSYPIPSIRLTGSPTTIDFTAGGTNPSLGDGGPLAATTPGYTPSPLVDVILNVDGNSTIPTFAGTVVGQILRINQTAAFTTTIDRTQCALPGSASVALAQNQILQLLCVATSGHGVRLIAMSSITNNG